MIACPDASFEDLRSNLLAELNICLSSVKNHLERYKFISVGISRWLNNLDLTKNEIITGDVDLIHAFNSQNDIGTRGLLFGFISK